jgi:hypothetical protein
MDRTLQPNTTQFPDILTDQVMPLVTGNEWKVIHYGVRYALGHRSTDTLTIAQIAHGRQADDGAWIDRGAGLSEADVKECLAYLCDVVHIFLREDRPRRPLGYRLNLDLSSINWATLQERGSAPPPQASLADRLAPLAAFVETPASDIRLDGSDRPLLVKLQESLRADEQQSFNHLVALAQKKTIGQDDKTIWQLYKLWQAYGFRRLQNAFQSPAPVASLDDINHSCLVGAVAEMLEAEQFGRITPAFREQIIEMVREFPRLIDWQEAISVAVKINKRRLKTVETILKNKTAPPSVPEATGEIAHAGPAITAPGRKRTARRASDYSEEELHAAREAERGKEWSRPADE